MDLNQRLSRFLGGVLVAAAALSATGVSTAQVVEVPGRSLITQDDVAQDDKKPRDVSLFHLDKKGLALGGYDPVAYFPEGGGKAKKGSKKIVLVQDGVRYRFSSDRHRRLFEKNPARYEPAYGGWCAYSMATRNERVDPSNKNFLIQDGKLMVFAKGWFSNGRTAWKKEGPAELIKKADRNWARMLKAKRG